MSRENVEIVRAIYEEWGKGNFRAGGEQFGTAAEAREVVQMATDVDAEAAGRYAVTGTLKGQGSAETVGIVADCLKSG
jgi:hypothetical protein